MSKENSKLYLVIMLASALLAAGLVYHQWRETVGLVELISSASSPTTTPNQALSVRLKKRVRKPSQRPVKGIYLTAYSAGDPRKLASIMDLIGRTELNAVVIDIKDYSGQVLYDSALPMVNELNIEHNRLGDLPALIEQLHRQDIYVIARQSVFQDPMLANKKPVWAIRQKGGGAWRDYKGLSWADPTRREVWDYNIALAKEAIALGFDEINFDYVRFPSDGDLKAVVYATGDKRHYEAISEFYRYLDQALSAEPAWLSVDLFGLTMEAAGEDDLNIGQRLADALDRVDYISPMMYPSHYPRGHLGLDNPAAFPERVVSHGLQKGAPRFVGQRAKLRPWLQAFNLGAVYDADKIRAQIEAVEAYTDAGWLLWNAANRYTSAGLKLD